MKSKTCSSQTILPFNVGRAQAAHAVVDARAEAEFPANMSAAIRIRTRNDTFETFVVEPKGEPGNFLNDSEFRRKFEDLSAPYLGRIGTGRLADALLSLEQANTISPVMILSQEQG